MQNTIKIKNKRWLEISRKLLIKKNEHRILYEQAIYWLYVNKLLRKLPNIVNKFKKQNIKNDNNV